MIIPKNWDRFQHYRHRSPPWIKLHRSLLDNPAFICLPLASRALAPCLWLLASEYEGGAITDSNEAVAFRLRLTNEEFMLALNPLISAGFFDCEQSASEMLASRKQSALLEIERETEIEKKDSCPKSPLSDQRKSPRVRKAVSYSPEFESFWKLYPDITNNSKMKASIEWQKLSESDRAAAVASLDAFRSYCSRTPDYRCVHCERYLRDRRFDQWAAAPVVLRPVMV